MMYQVAIGDITVTLDDELPERTTPEHARDYLRTCADEALRVLNGLPDALPAEGNGD